MQRSSTRAPRRRLSSQSQTSYSSTATTAPCESPMRLFGEIQRTPAKEIGEKAAAPLATELAITQTTPALAAIRDISNPAALSSEPPPGFILAAEAESVPSNLDRLPPNCRKRKNESVGEKGEHKRGRQGSLVGHTRKPEQRGMCKATEKQGPMHDSLATMENSPPRNMVRRSARCATTASVDTPQATELAGDIARKDSTPSAKQAAVSHAPSGNKTTRAQDETVDGTEKDTITGHNDSSAPNRDSGTNGARPSVESRAQLPDPRVADVAPYDCMENTTRDSCTPRASAAPAQTHLVGHVQLLARFSTSNGVAEILIPEDRMNGDEIEIIRQYAEWCALPNAPPVPYDLFRTIFLFARKD